MIKDFSRRDESWGVVSEGQVFPGKSVSEERGIVKSGYLLVGMRIEGFLLDSPSSPADEMDESSPLNPSLSSAFGPSLHLCLCKMKLPFCPLVCVNHRGLLKASFL